MNLKDNIDFVGHFGIKAYKKDGTIEEYEDKNLIMDRARQNMAQLVGGVTVGGDTIQGKEINRFVIGTEGHIGTNILDYKKVGGSEGFNSTRTNIFSQASNGEFYTIPFDVKGDTDVTDNPTNCVNSKVSGNETCRVRRTVSNRTCTYIITIWDASGNSYTQNETSGTSVIAYTEAALYAGADIFSMKTFPARVKEDTVKFEITWSIIF